MTNVRKFSAQGLHHIAVQTRDWEASLRLYRDVLGFPIAGWVPSHGKIALLAVGDGSYIELFEPKDDTPAVGSPAANDPMRHIAIRVDDVAAAIEHVRTAGYEVTMEATRVQGDDGFDATIAFFTGPSGESIEFVKSVL